VVSPSEAHRSCARILFWRRPLPPCVRQQNILQAATQDENLPSRALGQHLPTKPPPCGTRTLSFLSCFSLSYVCLHFPSHHLYPQDHLYYTKSRQPKKVAHMYIRQPSYSSRRASHSNQKLLPPPFYSPVCSLFSLGERLGGTTVHVISTDLSLSRSSQVSAPLSPLSSCLFTFQDGTFTLVAGPTGLPRAEGEVSE